MVVFDETEILTAGFPSIGRLFEIRPNSGLGGEVCHQFGTLVPPSALLDLTYSIRPPYPPTGLPKNSLTPYPSLFFLHFFSLPALSAYFILCPTQREFLSKIIWPVRRLERSARRALIFQKSICDTSPEKWSKLNLHHSQFHPNDKELL